MAITVAEHGVDAVRPAAEIHPFSSSRGSSVIRYTILRHEPIPAQSAPIRTRRGAAERGEQAVDFVLQA